MIPIHSDPHVIVELTQTSADGSANIRWDSWEHKRLFENVEIELGMNQSSDARITLFDPKSKFLDRYSKVTERTLVRVWMGFGRDLGEPVFKGILAQIERGETSTTLIAFDMGFVMRLLKRSGYKNKKDDLGIIRGLIERNPPLTFEGPDEALKLEPYNTATQDEQSDWDWMTERARVAGLEFYVRGDTVFVKKPMARVGKRGARLRLEFGKDFRVVSDWSLIYRTPENADGKPKNVKYRRRDRKGKFVTGESDQSQTGREDTRIKQDVPQSSKSKLTKRAQAQKDLEKEYAFEATIELIKPEMKPHLDVRQVVELRGVGQLFSGKYLTRRVNFIFSPGEMTMAVELYRDIET